MHDKWKKFYDIKTKLLIAFYSVSSKNNKADYLIELIKLNECPHYSKIQSYFKEAYQKLFLKNISQ